MAHNVLATGGSASRASSFSLPARCYLYELYETKVCILVHSRNRNERPDP